MRNVVFREASKVPLAYFNPNVNQVNESVSDVFDSSPSLIQSHRALRCQTTVVVVPFWFRCTRSSVG
ncbi:hypothetical protein F2P81_023798 [Scophthalmus maximus]|uniref:Uncharacterized protein n=1 Tax=Scophthalmus maximus TaxID=52904 RepID=A0A6A4RSZ7_SCOMX|nr:hypothetical protein F2P81_023798 [Scophthalmus maximus]